MFIGTANFNAEGEVQLHQPAANYAVLEKMEVINTSNDLSKTLPYPIRDECSSRNFEQAPMATANTEPSQSSQDEDQKHTDFRWSVAASKILVQQYDSSKEFLESLRFKNKEKI